LSYKLRNYIALVNYKAISLYNQVIAYVIYAYLVFEVKNEENTKHALQKISKYAQVIPDHTQTLGLLMYQADKDKHQNF